MFKLYRINPYKLKNLDVLHFRCCSSLNYCVPQNIGTKENKTMATAGFKNLRSNVLINNRFYATTATSVLDSVTFEKVCDETLESLCEYLEILVETAGHLRDADVSYGTGVLTIKFGEPYGTYVINRQTPNKQIWLSSPTSGPKRYDYVEDKGGYWVYKHNGQTLHELLQDEIPKIIKKDVDFTSCLYSYLRNK